MSVGAKPWFPSSIGVAVAAALLPGCEPAGRATYEVRDQAVAGSELKLVVETLRHYRPALSHSSKVADVKGWLVTIDLASDQPLVESARIFGPLWDLPDPRSWMSYGAGASFTDQDEAAAAGSPGFAFDADGTLLRFSRDGGSGANVRDAFVAGPAGGSWKRLGDVKPVDDRVEPMSEDRLLTRSGRWCLLRTGRSVQLYDLFTGERRDDPWLTGCFAHARSIRRFENVAYYLTEELDHLVVAPVAKWNTGGREPVTTFELDGKTYRRGEVGIAYSRPDPTPHLFPRRQTAEPDPWPIGPDDAFSFDGELRLFSFDERVLRLCRPDGSGEVVLDVGEALAKKFLFNDRAIHLPATQQLLIFHYGEVSPDTDHRATVGVATWDLAANAITDREVRLADQFELRDGELRPKHAIPVR
jgi:hypothetical protein